MRRLPRVLVLSMLVVLCALALAPVAGAANPPEGTWEWAQPFASTASACSAITAGPAGSVYVAGDARRLEWVVSRVATTDGGELWTDTRLGPGDQGASARMLATDGKKNLYVAGFAKVSGTDIYLVKYSPAGAVLWQKTWGGAPANLEDTPKSLAVTRAGSAYVAGTIGQVGGYSNAVLLKYDAAGHLKWKYVMATALYDSFSGVACDGLGNAYVTGQRNGTMGSSQMVTLKIDPAGHRVWQRTFGGPGVSYSGDFVRVQGSAVYVAGTLYKRDAWPVVARYSLAGKQTWALAESHSIGTVDDMTVDNLGRVVIVGGCEAAPGAATIWTAYMEAFAADGSGLTVSSTFYFDSTPTLKWPARFNKVVVDSTGAIYCAGGWDTDATAAAGNAIVVRFPPVDSPSWAGADKIWRYDGPASGLDEFYGLLRLNDSQVYAAGSRATAAGYQGIVDRITLP